MRTRGLDFSRKNSGGGVGLLFSRNRKLRPEGNYTGSYKKTFTVL